MCAVVAEVKQVKELVLTGLCRFKKSVVSSRRRHSRVSEVNTECLNDDAQWSETYLSKKQCKYICTMFVCRILTRQAGTGRV